MEWIKEYNRWREFPNLECDLKTQLMGVSESELIDSFYSNLTFGTGGIRGKIGPGTNRLNIYTIRKATVGLSQFIEASGETAKTRGVVIAYDCRYKSAEFAMEVAKVLGKHGITTYLFDSLRPTPVLAFAVRHLQAFAGVVLTASHNPPEYNGYKVYNEDGGQLTPKTAKILIKYVNDVKDELAVEVAEIEALRAKGLLKTIGEEVDQAYLQQMKRIIINPKLIAKMGKELKIVFSPLHGTGRFPVQNGLKMLGFENVIVVKEQEQPDPDFSTVKSPNPEEAEAFKLAIQYGNRVNADVLLTTDPDADRLGVAVKNHEDNYLILTANQVGALMLYYLLSQKQAKGALPRNGVVLKTIVTSEIGRVIASDFGLETVETLTGFKYIGEKIKAYEKTGEYDFQFAYEESNGYLIGDFIRDKDAVQATLFTCEIVAYYKEQGMTLYDGLLEIFEKYGYFCEDLVSITLEGVKGAQQVQEIMRSFREKPPQKIAGTTIRIKEDYLLGERIDLKSNVKEQILLPLANVLKYYLADGSWFCLRPSGTEPKIKFYFGVKERSLKCSQQKLENLKGFMDDFEMLNLKEVGDNNENPPNKYGLRNW